MFCILITIKPAAGSRSGPHWGQRFWYCCRWWAAPSCSPGSPSAPSWPPNPRAGWLSGCQRPKTSSPCWFAPQASSRASCCSTSTPARTASGWRRCLRRLPSPLGRGRPRWPSAMPRPAQPAAGKPYWSLWLCPRPPAISLSPPVSWPPSRNGTGCCGWAFPARSPPTSWPSAAFPAGCRLSRPGRHRASFPGGTKTAPSRPATGLPPGRRCGTRFSGKISNCSPRPSLRPSGPTARSC